MIKALIIENDHRTVGDCSKLLSSVADVQVLGVVSDYQTAKRLLKNDQPDVVFCNPKLSTESKVVDIAIEIRKEFDVKVVVLGNSVRIKEEMDKLYPYEYLQNTNNLQAYKNVLNSLFNIKVA